MGGAWTVLMCLRIEIFEGGLVKTMMNYGVPYNAENFLTS